jgi:3-hydroxybutyryl-CoA dehydrogenase
MKIGVIGAGAMGSGIAEVAATAGNEVILYDNYIGAKDKFEKGLDKNLGRLIEKGKITTEQATSIRSNIHFVSHLEKFEGCDLVIEAIVENINVKQEIFARLESQVGDACILASNTSSLSITAIGATCNRPERFVGIHFFNPATLMPLVEIIPGVATSADTLQLAKKIIDSWGKVTVVAKDTPGFIVNRIARPFYGEAIRLYEEGIAGLPAGESGFATIDWAVKTYGGFKMGPFELMDFIGNDINYTVTETVYKEFWNDPKYKPSFTQKRMVEAKRLGKKTGQGYYNYSENAILPEPDKNEELGKNICWRILVMLINEAAEALYLNIATREDIDLAMTKGVNYPKGLLKWADEMGIQHCLDTMDRLFNEYHEERYRASALLRKMVREGTTFY